MHLGGYGYSGRVDGTFGLTLNATSIQYFGNINVTNASGTLALTDPDKAAALFLQMVFSELHERWLFGNEQELAQLDLTSHLHYVVDLFLMGAAPRP